MSLLNSMFSGVSGLKNHQTMLDVIGNNIANVNSIGFKSSRVTFSDTFNQSVKYGSDPTDTSGGTNTYQVGLGMKVSSIDRDWTQGTFETTSSATDLALQGDGLFVLKNNGQTFYSRDGSFSFDSAGRLVNSQGAVVQGKIATEEGVVPSGNNLEDVKINTNLKLPAVATTLATWGGNLSSKASITRSESFEESGNIPSSLSNGDTTTESNTIYDSYGNAYIFEATYTKTAANTYTLDFTVTDSEGTERYNSATETVPTTQTMVFDGTTGALLTMDGAAPAAVQIVNNYLTGKGIDFNYDPTGVTQTSAANTLTSVVDDNRESTIVTGTVTIFDSLGTSHQMSLKFTKLSDNNWAWAASVPSSSGQLTSNTGTITFNSDGSINNVKPNPPFVKFTPTGGASATNIELNFGKEFDGITQTSSDSVASAESQNGSAAASLTDYSIDQYGYIVGVFSNGESRKLAQILLADFPNTAGLTSVGDNLYRVGANSGNALIGEPGEGTGTTIQSGSLEQSNVDLSEEMTRMIVAQRGYQANARTITVSDTLLQEINNLVR
jgi:flagellar hook protein FlgE